MKASLRAIVSVWLFFFGSLVCSFAQAAAQPPAPPSGPPPQPEFVKQGQQLIRDGKPQDALALYRQTLKNSPDSIPANIATGSVLDLMGKGEDARKYFAKAIDVADTPQGRTSAQRAMAMSYAFEGNCGKAIEYEQPVFDFYGSAKNFFQQGEIEESHCGI